MRADAAAAGIGPDQFWTLTPLEIGLTIRGYVKHLRNLRRIATVATTHIVNAWGAKTSPESLMPDFHED